MDEYTSKFLIAEPPLQVLPSLAVAIGLNEAIVLQQVYYWLRRSTHERDGRKWIYNTYAQWHDQFPFWSEKTIRNTIGSLEKQGLLLSGQYSEHARDRTKWYSIDFAQLAAIEAGKCNRQDLPDGPGKDGPVHPAKVAASSIAETTTENTQEDDPTFILRVSRRYRIDPGTATVLARQCRDSEGRLRRATFEETAFKNRGLK